MSQMAELLESFPKSDSPIQYLKKVRLVKAKDLMVQEGMKAYIAADRVGYESSSQFSREFKRYFGQNPQPGAAARRRQQTAGPCQSTDA